MTRQQLQQLTNKTMKVSELNNVHVQSTENKTLASNKGNRKVNTAREVIAQVTFAFSTLFLQQQQQKTNLIEWRPKPKANYNNCINDVF